MTASAESGRTTRPWGRTVLVHVGLWTGLMLLLVIPDGGSPDGSSRWTERVGFALSLLALAAPPVYVHFALLDRFFLRGRYGLHAALLGTLTIGWALAFNVLFRVWTGREPGLAYLVIVILIVVLLSSTLRIVGELARQRAELEETRARQLQSELDLLKAQIHPHFLFNTLNNLFGLARKGEQAAADGIARLSHLLRYMIYESGAGLVDLEKEVDQIRRLVELERLRFSGSDPIEVTLAVDPDLSGARVPPMLLVPLVENAFKHGVRRSAPSFVRVALSAEGGAIRFAVENSLHAPRAGVEVEAPGIGLQNVRRRLALLYPDTHDLTVSEEGGVFRAELRLGAPSGRIGR